MWAIRSYLEMGQTKEIYLFIEIYSQNKLEKDLHAKLIPFVEHQYYHHLPSDFCYLYFQPCQSHQILAILQILFSMEQIIIQFFKINENLHNANLEAITKEPAITNHLLAF